MLKIKSHFSGFLYSILECYTSRIAEKNYFYFSSVTLFLLSSAERSSVNLLEEFFSEIVRKYPENIIETNFEKDKTV